MMSPTCFESEGSSSGRRMYLRGWYNMFYVNDYKQYCTCIIISQCMVQKTNNQKKITPHHLQPSL